MSSLKRATTAPRTPRPPIANIAFIAAGASVLSLSQDRSTFFGRNITNTNVLQFSTTVDTSTTPTWTTAYTFPAGESVQAILELPNGEALVTVNFSSGPTLSKVYYSTGWAANKTTATWTQSLVTIGGNITPVYGFNQACVGADGTVVVSESGSQTTGGSGNQAADILKARRYWKSSNFGVTFTLILDIYLYAATQGFPFPAGVHPHGVGYDNDWKRIYAIFGDNTGLGRDIAGVGNAQVLYSDDGGTTWNKLKNPPFSDNSTLNTTLQFIAIKIWSGAIAFTPDVSPVIAPLIIPKVGYRKFGTAHWGPLYTINNAIGGHITKARPDANLPTFFGADVGSVTQTGIYRWRVMLTTDDGFTWSYITGDIPLQSPAITTFGFRAILGPTIRGKIVGLSAMYMNNETTKTTMVADLFAPEFISV